ncbi:UDP-2,4-diacetamido-2,4,6-trideoxy-beta-L-altropyranose hydrolase [Fontisphaera persica]|uniref:UDP-2,4-diacetamido-2,4, 6-trideoxy-beta-L-altropyranose hydrolase n=1 Tax=Fontisphaera persica TaxID=2974023 RepID=UPI0024C091EA|nr:UDP-2,4-diacetamido-2,4,6-trideoxy-beta-L-altropyranose hydrolase [Fontisphaera persica]WCJ58883.1 UDP-2,4-diacetamido-2,4,6-trideoxy-beta-L-altropyranose hydrolase [Fontisphaera persica]
MIIKPRTLLLRADASPAMGTGHVMRCLALAEAWQAAGGQAVLLSRDLPPALAARAQAQNATVIPLPPETSAGEDTRFTAQTAAQHDARWVVVDGYQFPLPLCAMLQAAGLQVLWVDDFGVPAEFAPDLLLNQNLGAAPAWYPHVPPRTELLLGPRYALLRREFARWRHSPRTFPAQAQKLLVTLGGSDPANATAKVIEALHLLGGAAPQALVLAGAANPHAAALARALAGTPHQCLPHVPDMPARMAEADLAIAAGGTTVWELAFMGLPALLLCLADNQRRNCHELAAAGAAVNLGWHETATPDQIAAALTALAADATRRAAMSAAGRALVDGRGAERVCLHLRENEVRLRPATSNDARLVYEWFNEPSVRAVSFSPEPVSWEHHLAWFKARLADPRHVLWIAEATPGRPVGQARFALDGHTATISISLSAETRGQGWGTLLIWAACRKLCREHPEIRRVEAWIKPDNQPSLRAFAKADFLPWAEKDVRGQPALVYEWKRPL